MVKSVLQDAQKDGRSNAKAILKSIDKFPKLEGLWGKKQTKRD